MNTEPIQVVWQSYRRGITPCREERVYGEVYLIICTVTGMGYIGQTTQGVSKRWGKNGLPAYRGCRRIQNAIKKYGSASFSISVLDTASSQEELDMLEAHYIRTYDTLSPNGYNLRAGGRGKGVNHPDTIERMREAARNSPAAQAHRKQLTESQRGVPRNPEHVKNLINASKARKGDPYWSARISAYIRGSAKFYDSQRAKRGMKFSEDHNKRLSESCKVSDKVRANIARLADNKRGKARTWKISPEQRAKLSMSLRGRKFSEETKMNMSIAAKRRWSNKKEALG